MKNGRSKRIEARQYLLSYYDHVLCFMLHIVICLHVSYTFCHNIRRDHTAAKKKFAWNYKIDLNHKGPSTWAIFLREMNERICSLHPHPNRFILGRRDFFLFLLIYRCQCYCCLFIIIIECVECTVSLLIDLYARWGGFVCICEYFPHGTKMLQFIRFCLGFFFSAIFVLQLWGRIFLWIKWNVHLISHQTIPADDKVQSKILFSRFVMYCTYPNCRRFNAKIYTTNKKKWMKYTYQRIIRCIFYNFD